MMCVSATGLVKMDVHGVYVVAENVESKEGSVGPTNELIGQEAIPVMGAKEISQGLSFLSEDLKLQWESNT